MRHFILVVVFASLLSACNNAKPEQDSNSFKSSESDHLAAAPVAVQTAMDPKMLEMRTDATGEPIPDQLRIEQTTTQKKIVKDGTMGIKTDNIAESKKRFDALLKTLNAYYELEDLQNNDAQIRYELKIRIPAENFEKLISGIESGGDEITNKNIQARDVTEEYLDIATRLENKRAYMKRYQELLTKAQKIEDILSIDENIRTLQEEIESSEGRLKFLNDQVAFSTLTITLFKTKEYVYKPAQKDKFTERIKSALSNGWSGLVDFIVGLFVIWPWLLILFIAYKMIRRILKRMKNKS
ncbi:MAG: DUF4349 domain-containing protein [bacterium]|nr:DUF4349 domain-containing protein [bacterium]